MHPNLVELELEDMSVEPGNITEEVLVRLITPDRPTTIVAPTIEKPPVTRVKSMVETTWSSPPLKTGVWIGVLDGLLHQTLTGRQDKRYTTVVAKTLAPTPITEIPTRSLLTKTTSLRWWWPPLSLSPCREFRVWNNSTEILTQFTPTSCLLINLPTLYRTDYRSCLPRTNYLWERTTRVGNRQTSGTYCHLPTPSLVSEWGWGAPYIRWPSPYHPDVVVRTYRWRDRSEDNSYINDLQMDN